MEPVGMAGHRFSYRARKSRRHLHGCGPPPLKRAPMKRSLLVAAFFHGLLFAVMTSSVIAQMQVTTPTDHRILSLLYVPHQVVRVLAWVGFHVYLEFEPGESFVN